MQSNDHWHMTSFIHVQVQHCSKLCKMEIIKFEDIHVLLNLNMSISWLLPSYDMRPSWSWSASLSKSSTSADVSCSPIFFITNLISQPWLEFNTNTTIYNFQRLISSDDDLFSTWFHQQLQSPDLPCQTLEMLHEFPPPNQYYLSSEPSC